MPSSATGGKSVYGAAVGILMLETAFPRVPGDIGNASTWPFPVLYKVVPGATGSRATTVRNEQQDYKDLLDAFEAAGVELVRAGADGLTTSCGFLSLFQNELASYCGVPVATSALMQIPTVQRTLPPGQRVGVLTFSAELLGPEHLRAAGASPETPIAGIEHGREFWRVMTNGETKLDIEAARQDVLDAGDQLVSQHDDIGAVVLECTNMSPFTRALRKRLGIPVYDIRSFVTWFQAGLDPCSFGLPGDPI